jgi:hypothetical protein
MVVKAPKSKSVKERGTDLDSHSEERTQYDAYTELGKDPDCNVEYAFWAQAEVILADEDYDYPSESMGE